MRRRESCLAPATPLHPHTARLASSLGANRLLPRAASHPPPYCAHTSTPPTHSQLITYDSYTGAVRNSSSQPQGYNESSVWSRGQAWAILGFAIANRYLGVQRYLDASRAAAECYVRLSQSTRVEDAMPLWDFYVPRALAVVDTSAAAVAALGLLEIAAALPADAEAPARSFYLAASKALLDCMLAKYLFSPVASDAVLANGTSTWPEWGVPLPYGDYYLLAALLKWDATPLQWRKEAVELLAVVGFGGLTPPASEGGRAV